MLRLICGYQLGIIADRAEEFMIAGRQSRLRFWSAMLPSMVPPISATHLPTTFRVTPLTVALAPLLLISTA